MEDKFVTLIQSHTYIYTHMSLRTYFTRVCHRSEDEFSFNGLTLTKIHKCKFGFIAGVFKYIDE